MSIRMLRGFSFRHFLKKYSLFYLIEINKRVKSKDLSINSLIYLNPYFYMLLYFFLNKIDWAIKLRIWAIY